MFDELRDSLRAFSTRLDPDERRRMTSGMREAMVHAKLAIGDLRAALATTEQRLRAEQSELETVRRRQGLAAGIGDQDTVAIAERFATQHAERVAVLEAKRLVQQQELALAEREYETMSAELRRVVSGLAPDVGATGAPPGNTASAEAAAMREVEALLADAPHGAGGAPGDPGFDGTAPPRRTRAEREADADARLADLKRQLGR